MTKPEPAGAWRIQFFRRHKADDPLELVPAIEFLDSIPPNAAAEIHAVLAAVAAAPPPSFSGGGKWEAMRGDMAGIFEVRVRYRQVNYRLFCVLVRRVSEHERPSLVCLGGLSKPVRSAARPTDYERIKQFADEFRRHQRLR